MNDEEGYYRFCSVFIFAFLSQYLYWRYSPIEIHSRSPRYMIETAVKSSYMSPERGPSQKHEIRTRQNDKGITSGIGT